ncbi:MAG: DUF5985 family protein [Gemmatimonadaceae bacterium]
MRTFVAGLLVMGYGVAALYFARFWRDTSDRLFLFFAAAFALLAAQRAILATRDVLPDAPIGPTWLYVVRLAAFVLILIAIVDKNRGRTPPH